MADIKPIIENSFNQYAGAVLQSRALVDSRDCVKPSARQIFYSMLQRKLTHDKPHKKTANAVGMAMADYYIHGDSSCEGVIMRAGQDFSMRYPLIDIKGNMGSLAESGNWAAGRYTESRTSALMDDMFDDIEKHTIDDWRDNYDNTKQYPGVLPSKGYYNICNGSFGIGVGMSSSIPQFNLREVNEALETLLTNPTVSDDQIIPMPDFATGACLLNPSEVRESLKNGSGKACLLRATVQYDAKDNCLVVTEIPYSVYTNTIIAEIDQILQSEDNPGINTRNDLTGKTPLIKIYLTKNANPQTVLKYLYKNTSLQYWYSINLTMLENGRYPKLFTWREALQSHINHEKIIYRRGFEFDKQKAEDRLHIVEGLLIARANIDQVIKIIKEAANPGNAKGALKVIFNLTDVQAQAILDMKLSRLTHLEVEKLENEKLELIDKVRKIEFILSNEKVFNEHLIRGWRKVAEKYGDERRTKITPMEEKHTPTIEEKPVVHMITTNGEVIVEEPFKKMNNNSKTSPYYKKNILFGYKTTNIATNYLYNENGNIFKLEPNAKDIELVSPIGAFNIENKKYIIHVTNKGTVKKSLISDYKGFKRNATVGKIRENEKVVYIGAVNDSDYLLMLGTNGKILRVAVSDFTTSNKNTIGVKGMAVPVIAATSANEKELIVVICEDKIKVTKCSDYIISGKGCLGNVVADNTTKIYRINGADFYLIENGNKITYFASSDYIIKSNSAIGNKISSNNGVIW